MLAVTDLQRTIRFYCDHLGFRVGGTFTPPGQQTPVWCSLHRDECEMMFNTPPRECVERDVPRSAKNYQIYYINVDDAAALHAELKRKGLPVTDLRVTIYQMKEFELRDPDDYWLWFGQDTDEPPTVTEEELAE